MMSTDTQFLNPNNNSSGSFSSSLNLTAVVNGRPTQSNSKLPGLYNQALNSSWNPNNDVEWLDEINFGSELPSSSGYAEAEFRKSAIAKGRQGLWNEFRWELQSWLVCQFLYGEQAAMVTAARLSMCLSSSDEKQMAATQVADEAKHVETFGRYVDKYIEHPYPMSSSLESMLKTTLEDSDWDISLIGMQVIIEGLADATFRMGAATFHDPVIRRIVDLVAADEARHVAFGTVMLRDRVPHYSSSERRHREEFILDSASAIRNRFLFEELWERLDINKKAGREFALTSPLMKDFRRVVFAKIAKVLRSTDLMSLRLETELTRLGLV